MSVSLLFCLTLAAAGPVRSAGDPEFFRTLAETRQFTLGRPVGTRITPDDRSAIFLRSGPRSPVLGLFEMDLASGAVRELADPTALLAGREEALTAEERSRRERERQTLRGFTAFELAKDGRAVLVALSGKLYLIDRTRGRRPVELPGEGWIDPQFSPDGRSVAAVRDGEIHVISLADRSDAAITSGASETLTHGTSEFVAQEEMLRVHGFWWSPDSSQLLYQETDNRSVAVRHIADPLHPEAAPAKNYYPRAGTANARVRLGLIRRDGGATRWLDLDGAGFPYIAKVVWQEPAAPLSIVVQNRAQTIERLLGVDPVSGEVRELLRENDPAWLDLDTLSATPIWFRDGSRFLWTSERSGTWQVELHAADGARIRTLTPAHWHYRALIGCDESSARILALGSEDPAESLLWAFPLDGGPGVPIAAEPGMHSAAYFPEARLLVHTADLADGRYRAEVLGAADARHVADLPSVAERPAAWPNTQRLRTPGTPAFDAALTLPDAPVSGRLAVIVSVYAGPTVKTVTAARRDYLIDQWMANRGFAVVRVDGRGTPWQGRDWERAIRGDFISRALADQVAGLQALGRRFPQLDLNRVAVTGWSFGGYFTAMAVIRRPDIFRCGVAGAPVVTWENYDTHYTERYLGLPQENPEAYRVSDVTTYADGLSRPLLIVHGLTDDNVYFQHAVQLTQALFHAGRPFEFLPLLGTHLVSEPVERLRLETRVMEFIEHHLDAPP